MVKSYDCVNTESNCMVKSCNNVILWKIKQNCRFFAFFIQVSELASSGSLQSIQPVSMANWQS